MHNCVDLATCKDTIESYTCTCELGYVGDGVEGRWRTGCSGKTINVFKFLSLKS